MIVTHRLILSGNDDLVPSSLLLSSSQVIFIVSAVWESGPRRNREYIHLHHLSTNTCHLRMYAIPCKQKVRQQSCLGPTMIYIGRSTVLRT